MYERDKEDFRKWLIEDKNLSSRFAGDTLSRCKRLNKEVLKSIDLSVSSPEAYIKAIQDIKDYSNSGNRSVKTKYALSGTLVAAIKKYCEYKNPENFKDYNIGDYYRSQK